MRRVGRPRTRLEANLNVNFEHGRGSEQGIDMEAESHPYPPRPQPRTPDPRDETIDRITQLLTTIVQHQTHVSEITIERTRRVEATSFDGLEIQIVHMLGHMTGGYQYNSRIPWKFEEGLRYEIKTYVSATEHTEYGKLVESALKVERNINEAHRFNQQRQERSNQNWLVGGSNSKLLRAENYSRPTTSFQQKYVPDSSQALVKQPVGGSQQSGSVGRVRYPPC
ncbi:hypothetical protein JRO89_XS02G0254400 [Xanthoceras sorbifolium]|uniref:Uncharacterized protein n=1 Tax=Xanthoceras sorbifolium TaxID=99658 RepID=A0ABQ8IHL8_9ROSI|nr:hypothetical protein JRO89_XS02G0254400 [Xanthoceras sorbifolium]